MFTYENGLSVALLIWLLGFIRIILVANSKTQKNLKLVGKRMSYNLGMIVDYDFKYESIGWRIAKFFFFNVVLSLPFILFSWGYVLFICASYIYVFFKDFGAPQSVKEFRWKMRNVDMSFDQMIKELMKVQDQNPDDFEKIKMDMIENINQRKNQSNNTV